MWSGVARRVRARYNHPTQESLAIGVLGSLVVERAGEPVILGPKQRTLLLILLLHGSS